jgi:osmotically inducible protein OsmC
MWIARVFETRRLKEHKEHEEKLKNGRYKMAIRKAEATWKGTLKEGTGSMGLGSGAYEGNFSYQSRFEEGEGTNPEELIGAALAGCFSMSLGNELSKAGFPPTRIHTRAEVHLENVGGRSTITRIHLDTEGEAPGVDEANFQQIAEGAKKNCPVSRAVTGVEISLKAKLLR